MLIFKDKNDYLFMSKRKSTTKIPEQTDTELIKPKRRSKKTETKKTKKEAVLEDEPESSKKNEHVPEDEPKSSKRKEPVPEDESGSSKTKEPVSEEPESSKTKEPVSEEPESSKTKEPVSENEPETSKATPAIKLFVATPCYNGQVNVKYMQSVMNLQMILTNNDIEFQYFTIPFDSLIPRARNACVTRFMNTDYTHLMFIDADIEFNPNDVVKMLRSDKDVLGGCYSKKAIDFSSIYKNFNKVRNTMELVQSAGKYAFNFKESESHKIENGCIEVLDAPTGFLMIKRKVFQTMIEEYPEREYINDVVPYKISENDKFYDFFPSSIFEEDDGTNRYLSEDYGFCRLWQKLEGQIYIDLTISLNHIGQFTYCGNPMSFFKYSDNVDLK